MAQSSVQTDSRSKDERECALSPDRFLRLPDVTAITGLSDSHVYELMKAHEFPQNIKLSGRVVVWSQREVQAWQAKKVAERDDVSKRPASKRLARVKTEALGRAAKNRREK